MHYCHRERGGEKGGGRKREGSAVCFRFSERYRREKRKGCKDGRFPSRKQVFGRISAKGGKEIRYLANVCTRIYQEKKKEKGGGASWWLSEVKFSPAAQQGKKGPTGGSKLAHATGGRKKKGGRIVQKTFSGSRKRGKLNS